MLLHDSDLPARLRLQATKITIAILMITMSMLLLMLVSELSLSHHHRHHLMRRYMRLLPAEERPPRSQKQELYLVLLTRRLRMRVTALSFSTRSMERSSASHSRV